MMLLKQTCPVAVCRRFLYNVSQCLSDSKKTKYKFLRVSYRVSDTVAVARLLYSHLDACVENNACETRTHGKKRRKIITDKRTKARASKNV